MFFRNTFSHCFAGILLPVLLSAVILPAQAQNAAVADARLSRIVIGSGAAGAAGGNVTLRGTFGQALSGNTQAGNTTAILGFWPDISSTPVGVDDPGIPQDHAVAVDAYPNPASGSATIEIESLRPGIVRAAVYDAAGRLVADFGSRAYATPARETLSWNGRGIDGYPCPAGVYFIRVDARPAHGTAAGCTVKPLMLLR